MEDKLLELCNLWKHASQRYTNTKKAVTLAEKENDIARRDLENIANELLLELISRDMPNVSVDGMVFSQGTGKTTIIDEASAYKYLQKHPELLTRTRWDEEKKQSVPLFRISATALEHLKLNQFIRKEKYTKLNQKKEADNA
jgi:hypothetical protein